MTDEQIIQNCLAGNQQGYSALVKKYEKLVFTLSLRIVKDREDAHEVAQDAFLKAFRYLGDFRGDCKFSTWLYKIVYSTSLNHLRKKRPEILSFDDDAKPISLPTLHAQSADYLTEKNEQSQLIENAIAQLPTNYATIITLFYLYEQKIDEICITMEINNSNAKTQLSRARQRLKEILEQQNLVNRKM